MDRPHLDPETIGVYLEGQASTLQRADIEAHLAGCEDCYELFVECAREVAAAPGEEGHAPQDAPVGAIGAPTRGPAAWFRRQRGWWTAAAAAAAMVAALTWAVLQRTSTGEPRHSTEYVDLVASLGDDRIVLGRLSGGVPYAPAPTEVRGGSPEAIAPRVQAAAARVQTALDGDSRSEARAVIGVSYLVTGQAAGGVMELKQAAAADATNALVQNDLAVAYLERARGSGTLADLPRALAAADLAARLPHARSPVQPGARTRGAQPARRCHCCLAFVPRARLHLRLGHRSAAPH